MPATILMHPRVDADVRTRDRLTERLAELLAHEQILRQQAAPEAEATYWRLFGDVEAAQVGPRAGGVARRAARRTETRIQNARQRRARPPLSEPARHEFLWLHRRLVRRLHPQLDGHAASRDYLWAMVCRACRDGDLLQLRDCDRALCSEGEPADGLPEPVLRTALAHAQARIDRLENRFPLNLRASMADPVWVANRRAALRRRLPEPVVQARA